MERGRATPRRCVVARRRVRRWLGTTDTHALRLVQAFDHFATRAETFVRVLCQCPGNRWSIFLRKHRKTRFGMQMLRWYGRATSEAVGGHVYANRAIYAGLLAGVLLRLADDEGDEVSDDETS